RRRRGRLGGAARLNLRRTRRGLRLVDDREERRQLGDVAELLPGLAGARDLAFARDLALDDPLLQRGQLAKASGLAAGRANEPHRAPVRRRLGWARRRLRALALDLEQVPAGRALDRDPGLGDLRVVKLVFCMAFFAADIHRGARLVIARQGAS